MLVPARVAPPCPAPRAVRPAPPRAQCPPSPPAAVAGTAAERGGPGLRELRGGSTRARSLVSRSPAAEGTCRGEGPRATASEAGGPHRRRGFCAAGSRGPGLPGPAGSAGAREAPGEPAKPGRCEALMKKVTGGRGSGGVGRPRPPVMARPGPQVERGCGRSGLCPRVGAYARGTPSGWPGGVRTEEWRGDSALCVQPEVGPGGRVFLFPSRSLTKRCRVGIFRLR